MLSTIAKPFAALAIAAGLIAIVIAALGANPFSVFAALGEGVNDFKVGDAVFGVLEGGREGAYAEKLGISECDPVNFPGLLCLRPCHCGREHQTCNEFPPPHGLPPQGHDKDS